MGLRGPGTTAAQQKPRRKPGPKPIVKPRVMEEMRAIPIEELRGTKTAVLREQFNASQRTVIDARCEILKEKG
jgi:hypothetical protein